MESVVLEGFDVSVAEAYLLFGLLLLSKYCEDMFLDEDLELIEYEER